MIKYMAKEEFYITRERYTTENGKTRKLMELGSMARSIGLIVFKHELMKRKACPWIATDVKTK